MRHASACLLAISRHRENDTRRQAGVADVPFLPHVTHLLSVKGSIDS